MPYFSKHVKNCGKKTVGIKYKYKIIEEMRHPQDFFSLPHFFCLRLCKWRSTDYLIPYKHSADSTNIKTADTM